MAFKFPRSAPKRFTFRIVCVNVNDELSKGIAKSLSMYIPENKAIEYCPLNTNKACFIGE